MSGLPRQNLLPGAYRMCPITSIKIDTCLNDEIGIWPWPSGVVRERDEG